MNQLLSDNLIPIIVGVFLGLIGIIIQKARAYSLIAGYNTASPEERRKFDTAKVAIAIRNSHLIIGIIWILIPVFSDLLDLGQIKWMILIILHFVITISLIRNINTKEKYKRIN